MLHWAKCVMMAPGPLQAGMVRRYEGCELTVRARSGKSIFRFEPLEKPTCCSQNRQTVSGGASSRMGVRRWRPRIGTTYRQSSNAVVDNAQKRAGVPDDESVSLLDDSGEEEFFELHLAVGFEHRVRISTCALDQ